MPKLGQLKSCSFLFVKSFVTFYFKFLNLCIYHRKGEYRMEQKTLFSREGAERLKKRVIGHESERGQRLAGGLFHQINALHSIDFFPDYGIEKLLLDQKEKELQAIKSYPNLPKDLIHFTPSGASKCARELYYKANKMPKDEVLKFPYQRRWTRNASAVHEAVQRDLLYCEKHLTADKMFTVKRLENGLPAWEQNIKTAKVIEHNGVKFLLYGMCDGVLEYVPDGSPVLFEFKTKSTTIGAVGSYKLKEPAEEHRTQSTAYSIMFGIDEVLFMYESLAKDGWMKGEEAKPDFRTFYHKITAEDKKQLLDRFSMIAKSFYENELPPKEESKCLFCQYKTICAKNLKKDKGEVVDGK